MRKRKYNCPSKIGWKKECKMLNIRWSMKTVRYLPCHLPLTVLLSLIQDVIQPGKMQGDPEKYEVSKSVLKSSNVKSLESDIFGKQALYYQPMSDALLVLLWLGAPCKCT